MKPFNTQRTRGGVSKLRLLILATIAGGVPAAATPTLLNEPKDVAATVWGDTVSLIVSADGDGPVRYQWFKSEQALDAQTNAVLALKNVSFKNSGRYVVVLTDSSGSVTSRVATVSVPAPIHLDPKLSANIQLGEDPVVLASNRRAQAEPHIARSASDPRVLVAAFQEGRREAGASDVAGLAISRDGGISWERRLVPQLTTLNDGPYFAASKSVVASGFDGRIFVSHTVFRSPSTPPKSAVISVSLDNAETFAAPLPVYDVSEEASPAWLAVNTHPNTPTTGRLAVLFNIFDGVADQVWSTVSDDQGTSWSDPVPAGPSASVDPQVFFLPDGSFGIVYAHYLGAVGEPTSPARIEYARSPDGGTTFEEPVVIADLTGRLYHDPVARDGWDVPMACTDRDTGAIFVTFQAYSGTGAGRTPAILFTRSTDRGRTWTTPVQVNDSPAKIGVFNPCIAASADGQHVTIAFYDKRHNTPSSGQNLTDYYLAESFDAGATWEPNLRLSDVSSDLRKAPLTGIGRMYADYQGIVPAVSDNLPGVAVWIDTRNGNPDPFAIRISRTKGSTFETWRRLRFSSAELGDQTVSGPEADPDHDGLSNQTEYVFALDPKSPSPAPVHIHRDAPHGRAILTCEPSTPTRRDSTLLWEESTDLVEWHPATVVSLSTEAASQADRNRIVVTIDTTVNSGRYFRPRMQMIP